MFSLWRRALIAAALCGALAPIALGQSNVSRDLLSEIKQAQSELARQENEISAANLRLSKQVAEAQQSVTQLRIAAAQLQRSADDQTLGLDVLEARLQQWKDQERYQVGLLLELAEKNEAEADTQITFESARDNLSVAVTLLIANLNPSFESQTAIIKSGELIPGRSLKIGPVAWFLHDSGGGLLAKKEPNSSNSRVAMLLDESA
ncbi:MAG: hypothetical protein AAF385_12965, partial [Pseudomonadota bacterium]